MKLFRVPSPSPSLIKRTPCRSSSLGGLLLVALGLAFVIACPARASVIGVNAWVIGSNGLPDPSAVSANQFQFGIGFIDSAEAPTIYFNNLSFGYTTSADGSVVASGSWPLSPNITYISSDQSYVASANLINLTPGTTYLTNVWAFDSGNRFDYSFHVTTPALPHSSGHGTSVPETASTLALFGGALISLATLRRQLMI